MVRYDHDKIIIKDLWV